MTHTIGHILCSGRNESNAGIRKRDQADRPSLSRRVPEGSPSVRFASLLSDEALAYIELAGLRRRTAETPVT